MTVAASASRSLPRRVLIPQALEATCPALGASVHGFEGRTMGTTWSVKLAGPAMIDRGRLQRGIERELDVVVSEMSTWDAGSDLSRFNRAPAGTLHPLPPGFRHVLGAALSVAEASGGAFDPTAGPLVNLWGFGPQGRHGEAGFSPPGIDALTAVRGLCGWRRLEQENGCLRQPGGAYLDFSAIAKGFAVDQVARKLEAEGFESFLVEIGGELRGCGVKPDALPWWVHVQSPPGCALPPVMLAAHGVSIATSGDYQRLFFSADGRRLPHTIDPRTGRPIEHGLASVTVVHEECMLADAWSTALTVLGPRAGRNLAESQGLAALFISRREDGGFDESMTRAMEAMLA